MCHFPPHPPTNGPFIFSFPLKGSKLIPFSLLMQFPPSSRQVAIISLFLFSCDEALSKSSPPFFSLFFPPPFFRRGKCQFLRTDVLFRPTSALFRFPSAFHSLLLFFAAGEGGKRTSSRIFHIPLPVLWVFLFPALLSSDETGPDMRSSFFPAHGHDSPPLSLNRVLSLSKGRSLSPPYWERNLFLGFQVCPLPFLSSGIGRYVAFDNSVWPSTFVVAIFLFRTSWRAVLFSPPHLLKLHLPLVAMDPPCFRADEVLSLGGHAMPFLPLPSWGGVRARGNIFLVSIWRETVALSSNVSPSSITLPFFPLSPFSSIMALAECAFFSSKCLHRPFSFFLPSFRNVTHPLFHLKSLYCCIRRDWSFPPLS